MGFRVLPTSLHCISELQQSTQSLRQLLQDCARVCVSETICEAAPWREPVCYTSFIPLEVLMSPCESCFLKAEREPAKRKIQQWHRKEWEDRWVSDSRDSRGQCGVSGALTQHTSQHSPFLNYHRNTKLDMSVAHPWRWRINFKVFLLQYSTACFNSKYLLFTELQRLID